MMTLVLNAIIAVLTELLTSGTLTSTIAETIIQALIQILPTAINTAEELVPVVKNIISVLSTSGAVTPAQFTSLQALSAQCDAAFEAAAEAAGFAADPNAGTDMAHDPAPAAS